MTRCDLCGMRRATKPYPIASGRSLGDVCGDECGALLWEAHFERHAGAPAHEKAVTRWRISRRIAEAHGRPFTEAAPKSPAELELESTVEGRDWSYMAREVS